MSREDAQQQQSSNLASRIARLNCRIIDITRDIPRLEPKAQSFQEVSPNCYLDGREVEFGGRESGMEIRP